MSGVVIDSHDHGAWDTIVRQLQPTAPEGSIFVVAFGEDGKHVGSVRFTLPDPVDAALITQAGHGLIAAIRNRGWEPAQSVIAAYGPPHLTDPMMEMTQACMDVIGIEVLDSVRIYGPRCWSYLCPDPDHNATGPGVLLELVSDAAIQVATVLDLARDQEP